MRVNGYDSKLYFHLFVTFAGGAYVSLSPNSVNFCTTGFLCGIAAAGTMLFWKKPETNETTSQRFEHMHEPPHQE
jgi:hypothetical protein